MMGREELMEFRRQREAALAGMSAVGELRKRLAAIEERGRATMVHDPSTLASAADALEWGMALDALLAYHERLQEINARRVIEFIASTCPSCGERMGGDDHRTCWKCAYDKMAKRLVRCLLRYDERVAEVFVKIIDDGVEAMRAEGEQQDGEGLSDG